jgi:hypothetical protein
MGPWARRAVVVLIAAAVPLASTGALAGAVEAPTRAEYVIQLEAICKPGAKETQRAMDGVRDDVHASRIGVAAHKFSRAAQIFGKTVRKISAVSRPAADTARLKQWFSYLNRQEAYLKQIAAQLRAGRTIKAQRLTARFIHNGNLANNVVLSFGFNYCSFRFSRFG